MRYDIFISYARKDNRRTDVPNWVGLLIETLERAHRRVTPSDLRIFFDPQIETGADWELRLHNALRESNLLLAVLSPHYFESKWCREEWANFVRHELDRFVSGQGVFPVSIDGDAGFPPPTAPRELLDWSIDLSRRNYRKLPKDLAGSDVGATSPIADLEQNLSLQLARARAAREAPNSLPQHNPAFVGRGEERREIRHWLQGKAAIGAIVLLHGFPGIGKTALAAEYAHEDAALYGGRRFMLNCSGKTVLADLLLEIAPIIGVEFSDEQKKQSSLAVERLFDELRQRTQAAANEAVSAPASLIIFDHVDQPELFSIAQTNLLPREEWVHFLATTSLGPEQLATPLQTNAKQRILIAVDELSPDQSVELLARYQPNGVFAGGDQGDEAVAAQEIAHLLGGLPLALEAIGAYMGTNAGLVDFKGMAVRLNVGGLSEAEKIVGEVDQRHSAERNENRFSVAIAPLLESLSEQERYVLACASCLPADQIAIPWLATLARQRYPELCDECPGYPSPWPLLVRRLVGRRLLIPTNEVDADGLPRVVRMQRVLQRLCATTASEPIEQLQQRVTALIVQRAGRIRKTWSLSEDDFWEIGPLSTFAETATGDDPTLMRIIIAHVAVAELTMGRFNRATALYERAAKLFSDEKDPEIPVVMQMMIGSGMLANDRKLEAFNRLKESAESIERVAGPNHPMMPILLFQQGILAVQAGDLESAKAAFERGTVIARATRGEDAIEVAIFHLLHALLDAMGKSFDVCDQQVALAMSVVERQPEPMRSFMISASDALRGLLTLQRGNARAGMEAIRRACDAMYGQLPESLAFREVLPFVSAGILKEAKRYAEAEPAMLAAIAKCESHPMLRPLLLPIMLQQLAELYSAMRLPKKAVEALQRSLEIYRDGNQAESAAAATCHLKLGALQMKLLQFNPMIESFKAAGRIREKLFGVVSEETAEVFLLFYPILRLMALFPPVRAEAKGFIRKFTTELMEPLAKTSYIANAPPPALLAFKKIKRRIDLRFFLFGTALVLLIAAIVGGGGYLIFRIVRWLIHLI